MTAETAPVPKHDGLRIGGAAALALLLAVVAGALLGGQVAAWAAAAGAVAAAVVQGGAAFLLLRRRRASDVGFLGAFALAAFVRVAVGGTVVVVALSAGMPGPAGFLGGFVATYVVLEVATDAEFVRLERLGRLGRTG
jgi:hypothetical protein